MIPEMKNVITVRVASERLGVQQWVTRRLIREGHLRAVRAGYAVLIREADLERYQRERDGVRV